MAKIDDPKNYAERTVKTVKSFAKETTRPGALFDKRVIFEEKINGINVTKAVASKFVKNFDDVFGSGTKHSVFLSKSGKKSNAAGALYPGYICVPGDLLDLSMPRTPYGRGTGLVETPPFLMKAKSKLIEDLPISLSVPSGNGAFTANVYMSEAFISELNLPAKRFRRQVPDTCVTEADAKAWVRNQIRQLSNVKKCDPEFQFHAPAAPGDKPKRDESERIEFEAKKAKGIHALWMNENGESRLPYDFILPSDLKEDLKTKKDIIVDVSYIIDLPQIRRSKNMKDGSPEWKEFYTLLTKKKILELREQGYERDVDIFTFKKDKDATRSGFVFAGEVAERWSLRANSKSGEWFFSGSNSLLRSEQDYIAEATKKAPSKKRLAIQADTSVNPKINTDADIAYQVFEKRVDAAIKANEQEFQKRYLREHGL